MKWDLQTRCYSFFHFEDWLNRGKYLGKLHMFSVLKSSSLLGSNWSVCKVLLVGCPGLFVNVISVSGKVYYKIYSRRKGILQWYSMNPFEHTQVVRKCPLYTECYRISVLFSNNINLEVTLTFAKNLTFPVTSLIHHMQRYQAKARSMHRLRGKHLLGVISGKLHAFFPISVHRQHLLYRSLQCLECPTIGSFLKGLPKGINWFL